MLRKVFHSPLKFFSQRAVNFSTQEANRGIVAVFPGQGTQKVGMCQEFLEYDWSKQFLTQCDDKLQFSITKLMTEGPKETLDLTEYSQPAIFIQSYLKYERAKRSGQISEENIEYLFGHSLGEYNALVAAKSVEALELVPVLKTRGRLMQKCCEGKEAAMFAVLTDYEKVAAKVQEIKDQHPGLVCDIAAVNSGKQFIISGDLELLIHVKKELRKDRIAAARVNVSAAFHSKFLTPMKEEFKEVLSGLDWKKPERKVIRNYDVRIYQEKTDIIDGLVQQIDHPVLFRKTVEFCLGNELKRFIDVGEEGMITTMLRQNFKEIEVLQL